MIVSDGGREEKRVTDSAFAFFLSETINYLFDTSDLPPNNCTPPSLFYVPMVINFRGAQNDLKSS